MPRKRQNQLRTSSVIVKNGHYDGTIFHRVIDGFMIQGGGFTEDMHQKETGTPIENEADNGLTNDAYTVAMARTMDPHSATAQFFINVKKNDFLNHTAKNDQGWGYTVFAKVVKGHGVVNKIKGGTDRTQRHARGCSQRTRCHPKGGNRRRIIHFRSSMDKTETINMAVYCDFENVALGVRDARYAQFDIKKVLERLLLKGNIVVKKAYCDWERYKEFKAEMHEAAFELIEIPHVRQSGKNSADIRNGGRCSGLVLTPKPMWTPLSSSVAIRISPPWSANCAKTIRSSSVWASKTRVPTY